MLKHDFTCVAEKKWLPSGMETFGACVPFYPWNLESIPTLAPEPCRCGLARSTGALDSGTNVCTSRRNSKKRECRWPASQQFSLRREMPVTVLYLLTSCRNTQIRSLLVGQSVGLAWDEGSVKTEACEWEEWVDPPQGQESWLVTLSSPSTHVTSNSG